MLRPDRQYVRQHRRWREPLINQQTGCWEWQGSLTRSGYGQISREGLSIPAHRWFYERAKGPIPEGLHLDHLCRVRHCVNPDHLEPVTCRENVRRGANAHLTAEQVAEIRAHRPDAPRYGARALAAKYGVSEYHIHDIRNFRTWA